MSFKLGTYSNTGMTIWLPEAWESYKVQTKIYMYNFFFQNFCIFFLYKVGKGNVLRYIPILFLNSKCILPAPRLLFESCW